MEEPNEPEEEIPAAQTFMLTSPAPSPAKKEEVVEPEPPKDPKVGHFPQLHFHFGDHPSFDSNHSPNFNLLKSCQVR